MIKSFRFANCQLGNSLVLGPGALETGHMPRLPWWEDIVFIAAFLVTQHKIINFNIPGSFKTNNLFLATSVSGPLGLKLQELYKKNWIVPDLESELDNDTIMHFGRELTNCLDYSTEFYRVFYKFSRKEGHYWILALITVTFGKYCHKRSLRRKMKIWRYKNIEAHKTFFWKLLQGTSDKSWFVGC